MGESAIVECESVGNPAYFGRKDYEGLMVVDIPEVLVRGSRRFALKRLQPGEFQRFTFAVAPE